MRMRRPRRSWGRRIGGTDVENHVVVARREVFEEVIPTRVRGLRVGIWISFSIRGHGASVGVKKGHGHACQRRFAAGLEAVLIFVYPDIIADADRGEKAEVKGHVPVGVLTVVQDIALTGFGRGVQRLGGRGQGDDLAGDHGTAAARLLAFVVAVRIVIRIGLPAADGAAVGGDRIIFEARARSKSGSRDLDVIIARRQSLEEVIPLGIGQHTARSVIRRTQNAVRADRDLHIGGIEELDGYARNSGVGPVLDAVVVIVYEHRAAQADGHRQEPSIQGMVGLPVAAGRVHDDGESVPGLTERAGDHAVRVVEVGVIALSSILRSKLVHLAAGSGEVTGCRVVLVVGSVIAVEAEYHCVLGIWVQAGVAVVPGLIRISAVGEVVFPIGIRCGYGHQFARGFIV